VISILALGDLPGDDDDLRLRKRVGVAAGYITLIAHNVAVGRGTCVL
jgi:hypothetical protein